MEVGVGVGGGGLEFLWCLFFVLLLDSRIGFGWFGFGVWRESWTLLAQPGGNVSVVVGKDGKAVFGVEVWDVREGVHSDWAVVDVSLYAQAARPWEACGRDGGFCAGLWVQEGKVQVPAVQLCGELWGVADSVLVQAQASGPRPNPSLCLCQDPRGEKVRLPGLLLALGLQLRSPLGRPHNRLCRQDV